MPDHRFKTGQSVLLKRTLSMPGGAYVITKRLPERDGECEYRIKSAREAFERVARESELTKD